MSQASEAMKLSRSEGISLKEAWAQIKGGSPTEDGGEITEIRAFNTGEAE